MTKAMKLTKKDHFNAFLNYLDKNPNVKFTLANNDSSVEITASQMTEFVKHEVELLDKKNASDKKPTKQQLENEKFKQAIYDTMRPKDLYTVSEMMKFPVSVENDLSNQKITRFMYDMQKEGRVERIEDKRKAYFRKVVE